MNRTSILLFCLLCLSCSLVWGAEEDLPQLLATIRAVGPEAAGHETASAAWRRLAATDASRLPEILAGLDGAGPLAANWIATAAQAIVQRQQARQGPLPAAEIERFIADRKHGPSGRELAYEILLSLDPQVESRLVPGMLDDPCLPLRYLAVARLIDLADEAVKNKDNEKARKVLRQAFQFARDSEQTSRVGQQLKGLGEEVDLPRKMGYIVRWKLIAPFDNTGRKGFDAVFPPEGEFKPDAVYEGKTKKVSWMDFASKDRLGRIDFYRPFGQQREVVAYAATRFVAAKRQEVELRLSSLNATKVWLHGNLAGAHPIYHSGSQLDQYIDRVALEPGDNLILVKVCQNEQTQDWAQSWGFQLRVCDLQGDPVLSADRDQP